MKLQAIGLGAAMFLSAGAASAQQDNTVVVNAPPPRERAETTYMPNIPAVATGGALFLAGYVPSMFVAGLSSNPADEYLWIPVVGPWIDLGERANSCGVDCNAEAVNKILLVGNGIIQGAGIVTLIAGLATPMTTTKRETAKPHVQLQPMQFGRSSVGAGVSGTF